MDYNPFLLIPETNPFLVDRPSYHWAARHGYFGALTQTMSNAQLNQIRNHILANTSILPSPPFATPIWSPPQVNFPGPMSSHSSTSNVFAPPSPPPTPSQADDHIPGDIADEDPEKLNEILEACDVEEAIAESLSEACRARTGPSTAGPSVGPSTSPTTLPSTPPTTPPTTLPTTPPATLPSTPPATPPANLPSTVSTPPPLSPLTPLAGTPAATHIPNVGVVIDLTQEEGEAGRKPAPSSLTPLAGTRAATHIPNVGVLIDLTQEEDEPGTEPGIVTSTSTPASPVPASTAYSLTTPPPTTPQAMQPANPPSSPPTETAASDGGGGEAAADAESGSTGSKRKWRAQNYKRMRRKNRRALDL